MIQCILDFVCLRLCAVYAVLWFRWLLYAYMLKNKQNIAGLFCKSSRKVNTILCG